jgi:non-ribosomal peptide synthetase component F
VNLALSLLYAAERTPNAEALAGEGMRLTYRQLRTRAAEIAAGLTARGVERETARGACCQTSPRWSSSTGDAVARSVLRPSLVPHLAGRPRLLHRRFGRRMVVDDASDVRN